ncbi:hypothetical protein GWK08_03250 [Leptobacterium flavescens]|uniref:Bacteriocin n=1 Tax=Leptobacterium flavescens TaxID=472055 RepID=A0A6P0UGS2_9FLAO|nr:hypothetical protein [Leptobacterium flavescens]NER12444.1 hypothetical protein [Leptobacterium flavescens]
MFDNFLKLKGVKQLGKKQQKLIVGASDLSLVGSFCENDSDCCDPTAESLFLLECRSGVCDFAF